MGGFCVVADLGNAERAGAFPPRPGEIQARGYRAPETVAFLHHTAKADVFAAGVVVHELATHALLFDPDGASAEAVTRAHVRAIASALGPYPEWMRLAAPCFADEMRAADGDGALLPTLAEPLLGMLAVDPHRRHSAADALALLHADAPSPMAVG
jgi:serine/threonine protein kinase